jgi:hypothetical protein
LVFGELIVGLVRNSLLRVNREINFSSEFAAKPTLKSLPARRYVAASTVPTFMSAIGCGDPRAKNQGIS